MLATVEPTTLTEIPPHTPNTDPPDADPPTGFSLKRVGWSTTTLAFLIVGIVLLVRGEDGYATVTLVVAACAAINLL